MSDGVTATQSELPDPQGEWCYIILTVNMCHSVNTDPSPRSTQCGQALKDGERGDLGCEGTLVRHWGGATSQRRRSKGGL